jgi:hypothetical protein
MPVPGPRTQARALPGYANPDGESPDRWNLWERPGPISRVGMTPGTMEHTRDGRVLAPGQIRRMWRQAADQISAQAPFSWARNAPAPGRPVLAPEGFQITRALRYMARSVYAPAGTDNSRFVGFHSQIRPRVKSKPVTIPAGGVRNRPTVRNRITSFGSRVPPLNPKLPAGE